MMIEDTDTRIKEVREHFGGSIADIVLGCSEIKRAMGQISNACG